MSSEDFFSKVTPRASIDYMLRTTQNHHVQLSMMADQKANIIMGVTFIILTITLGYIQKNGLSFSFVLVTLFSLCAALFALMAVMPSTKRKKKINTDSSEFNPLFFSFFTQMKQDQYLQHMEKILMSDPEVYMTMLKDIYQLGSILYNKKYRYLTYSYKVLTIGLIISSFVALVEHIIPRIM